jgi:deoxyribonuclease V
MLSEEEALKQQVGTTDNLPAEIKPVAGVDVEYDKDSDRIAGAIVLLDYNTLDIIEIATHCMQVPFPPVLPEAWKQLKTTPDVIICVVHPRRFGLACHNGEHIGNVLRTQTGINPIFVSVGHKITDLVLKMSTAFRLPETTGKADQYAREALVMKYDG